MAHRLKLATLCGLALLLQGQAPGVGVGYRMRGAGGGAAGTGSAMLGTPSFDLYPKVSPGGVDNLDPNLTINGTTVTPTFRYKGGDCDATDCDAWGYGSAIPYDDNGGADPSYNTGSLLFRSSNDDSVTLNAADIYQVSDNTIADVTTGDMVFEYVGNLGSTGTTGIITKRDGSGAYWSLHTSSSTMQLQLYDGTDLSTVTTAALDISEISHLIIFLDRDGTGAVYVNGALSGSVSISATAETITNTGVLCFGARRCSDEIGKASATVMYVAMWQAAAWLDTGLQANVAKERFQRLIGWWPSVAKGTPLVNSLLRASGKTFPVATAGVTKLWSVGDNWVPVARIDPTASGTALATGVFIESGATNVALQSVTIQTTWTSLDAGDTQSLDAADDPFGNAVMDGTIADATDGPHGLAQAMTFTAATWACSAVANPGDRDWILIDNTTVANATLFCDIANCAVGTAGAAVIDTFTYDYGDAAGNCRCGFTFTGTAASHTLNFRSADADTDATITGDGATVNTNWGHFQCEANDRVSSIIGPTTTAPVARSGDTIVYPALENLGSNGDGLQNSIEMTVWAPDHNHSTGTLYWLSISDGGSASDGVFFKQPTNDVCRIDIASTESGTAVLSGSTDIMDGAVHTCALTMGTDDLEMFVDGSTEGTPDTSHTPPNGLDEMNVGSSYADNLQMDGIIERIRIWPRARKVP